jgi:Peptidase A4 family
MTGDAAEIRGSDRVRSLAPPPAGFDLGTASADALSRHGLPRRPDPEREPYLAERWASVFGRPLSIVAAELASDPLMSPNYGVDGWAGVGRAMVRLGISDPGIGGGSVPDGAYLVPATFVSAEWEVPQITGDPSNLDNYLAIWVGLDGFTEADQDLVEEPVPGQILRGGVMAVPGESEFQWVAWTEWYTSELGGVRATVTNFPVQSGDTVGVVICVTQPRSANMFLANLSREYGTSVVVSAPAAAPRLRSAGTTVEWIVEGGDPSTSLPFSPVTFQGCVAGSSSEVIHLQPDAVVTNMFEVEGFAERGPDVTRTGVTSPTIAVVEWVGAAAD